MYDTNNDTNDFLCRLASLPPLPNNVTLCNVDFVGPYPDIPHNERLIGIKKALDLRKNKRVSTDSLMNQHNVF